MSSVFADHLLKSWITGEPLGLIKKVIQRYRILSPGENFVVGVSGGVDSFTMLLLLDAYNRKFQLNWEIIPSFVDGGFPGTNLKKIVQTFSRYGFKIKVLKENIYPKLKKNKKNICFLCTRGRRKALVEEAVRNYSFKVAFAHHKEDVVEALFLNLIYNREFATMVPDQTILQGRIHIIRPLYFYDKVLIKKIADFLKFHPVSYTCPFRRFSRRMSIRRFLDREASGRTQIDNIFYGMKNIRWTYLP